MNLGVTADHASRPSPHASGQLDDQVALALRQRRVWRWSIVVISGAAVALAVAGVIRAALNGSTQWQILSLIAAVLVALVAALVVVRSGRAAQPRAVRHPLGQHELWLKILELVSVISLVLALIGLARAVNTNNVAFQALGVGLSFVVVVGLAMLKGEAQARRADTPLAD